MDQNNFDRRNIIAMLAAGPAAMAAFASLAQGGETAAPLGKVLMPIGDATETMDTSYAYFRIVEQGGGKYVDGPTVSVYRASNGDRFADGDDEMKVCGIALCMLALAVIGTMTSALRADDSADKAVGVVSHVKVLSDKVRDVSSMEAWKKSFIKDGMTDEQKALAIWKSTVMFRLQDAPPIESRHEECVHDPIKTFNVYGYGMCCCAASDIEALARYVGLQARGWALCGHSLPEVFYDNSWHMFDASLVNYFPKADGKAASVAEIVAAVKKWRAENPKVDLHQFMRRDGWMGYKKGPELLANCPFYSSGFWPARTHGWSSTMQEYSGAGGTPFPYEYGYSQGYEVNIQIRPGERLTRNWFNKGLHVNAVMHRGDTPACMDTHQGDVPEQMAYLKDYGDVAPGRIGNGALEYNVPLADGTFRSGAWKVDNLAARSEDSQGPALHVKDFEQPGLLEIRMPASYVYLAGNVALDAIVGEGGKIKLLLSDNNGLDWKPVAQIEKTGKQQVDLQQFVAGRYDYILRIVLGGKGTGLESLELSHDIQCSQRALPALDRGENTITFSAKAQEAAVTIEGTSYENPKWKGKNVQLADCHPVLSGDIHPQYFQVAGPSGQVTFPIAAPADMLRLRLGGFYRLRDRRDAWDVDVSFDGGQTWKKADHVNGPYQGICSYVTFTDVPAGARKALVRWSGTCRNTTAMFIARIDADYKQPHGGFRPVKVTYTWEEGGLEKKDVHVANSPEEAYKIICQSKPEMKSISLELAK